ncbi:MAG: histidine kinase dimerization/phosphoacceptor domain -containing protein [Methanobacterium sp.]
MDKGIKILMLEDVSYDAELIEYELRREKVDFSSKIVEDKEDYLRELEQYKPDIILADHSLPSFDGVSALKIAKKKYPDTPFFFVSGKIGEEFAVEMLKTGATDYIFKNNLSKLVPAIFRALKEAEEKAERAKAEKLLLQAHTELENRVEERTKELQKANEELENEIKRRMNLEEALQESETKLKEIIHFSPVPQFVIDNEHNVIYWNKALEIHSNINAAEIVGTKNHWKAFYESYHPCMADLLVDRLYEDIPKIFNGKYKRSPILDDACEAIDFFPSLGDNGKWLHFTAAAIRNSKGDIIGAVETLEDITHQKNAESKIMKSLEEKEVLLREIHHRVKNNLQIISSLIRLQSNCLNDVDTVEAFKEIQNRIKSIALIHEKLYQSENLSKINFAEYIPQLALELSKSYEISRVIDLEVNVEDVMLDINKALPCGLIINELITNSIKHAFPANFIDNQNEEKLLNSANLVYDESKYSDIKTKASPSPIRKGKISISFNYNGKCYEMKVMDNGIGYPENINLNNAETLGLRLIDSLKGQLNSEVELKNDNGAFFRLTFED